MSLTNPSEPEMSEEEREHRRRMIEHAADEREATQKLHDDYVGAVDEGQQVREQLAAERDEHGRITANLAIQVQKVTHQLTTVRELRKLEQEALAAAREECRYQRSVAQSWFNKHEQLREQLAAAVEAIAWLNEFVVEPDYFPGEGDRQYWQEKRASIAKIKEGK